MRKVIRESRSVIVMSPCHKLTIPLRFFTRKIILDAGWPLSESNFTRRVNWQTPIRVVVNYLTDFLSFHFAERVILESKAQKRYVRRMFLVGESKLDSMFTGLNEEAFLNSSPLEIPELEFSINKKKRMILFRGKWNLESGLDSLSRMSYLFGTDVLIVVASTNLPNSITFNEMNTLIIRRELEYHEIANLYKAARVTLGQLSNHSRLSRTLPHKVFESAYFAKPYITSKNPGICEFLSEDSAIFLTSDSDVENVNKINNLLLEDSKLKTLSRNIRNDYDRTCSYDVLSERLKRSLKLST
jgi:sensor histidine kinase YesM